MSLGTLVSSVKQRAELRVAILFDHEAEFVFGEERFDSGSSNGKPRTRMKSPTAPSSARMIERFAHRQIAAAERDDAERARPGGAG